ncbi:MAG: radical SAM family heme chaperone HemW [Alphaproteobacteria bacterium]
MTKPIDPFSLYIHIPYCISKCPYCDFNSHVVAEIPQAQYVSALVRELDGYGAVEDWDGRPVQSIFFGGGTPSTFAPASIGKLLNQVAATFPMRADCEITLEANPGTIDRDNFHGYHDAGVNRISIGVQSFQPGLLRFLGRAHSADEARQALQTVRHAGFENFSLDLIYANPGQSLRDLEADLNEALAFQPPHLSAYNLTFEEGTPFYREYRAGRIKSLSEEAEIAMAVFIEKKLRDAGLQRYEISNYARPGARSRHNVNYWRGGDYLGLGAGAHSYKRWDGNALFGKRWSNEKNPGRYMALAREGRAIVDQEEIDRAKAAGEFMFMGLRMTEGISSQAFASRFGPVPRAFYPQIDDWLEGELMEETNGYLRLTQKGLLLANSIFVDFL